MCEHCGLSASSILDGMNISCECIECEQLNYNCGTVPGYGIGETIYCPSCNHLVGHALSDYPAHEVRDFRHNGNAPHIPDYAVFVGPKNGIKGAKHAIKMGLYTPDPEVRPEYVLKKRSWINRLRKVK